MKGIAYRFWWFQLAGWSCFFIAMSFSRLGRFPLEAMLVNKGLLTVLGFSSSLLLHTVYRRLSWSSMSLPRLGLLVVGASCIASVVWTVPVNVLGGILQVFGNRVVYRLFDGLVYNAFVLVAWSALYVGITMYTSVAQERERRLQAQALAQEAELRALRYQLNPHFFFNTLNALSTLVLDDRKDDAADMISRMSDFMRATLKDGTPTCTLQDELEIIDLYLSIERIRFGDRLRVVVESDPDLSHTVVPRLLLQPVLENAIVHGISQLEDGGTISIRTFRSGSAVTIQVENTLPTVVRPSSGAGIGLRNVKDRLKAMLGTSTLRTATTEDNTMLVSIDLVVP